MDDRKNDFDNAFTQLILNEGNYSNDPVDKGGATIYGITSRDYPHSFSIIYQLYQSGNKELALHTAKNFYRKNFWDDLYEEIPDSSLSFKIFDLSVNRGKRTAIKILQKVLYYEFGKTIAIDGLFGGITLAAIQSVVNYDILYDKYIEYNEASYSTLATFYRFGRGWIKRLRRRVYV